MKGVETWGEAITVSLLSLGEKFLNFFPTFVGAVLVFVAGWIIATVFGKLVEKMLLSAKVDSTIEKIGYSKKHAYSVSEFGGGLVKWFLVMVFLMAATDILNLNQVTLFLNSIVLYIPNVIVAVVILTIVFMVGSFVYNIVKGSTAAAGVMSATLLATIAKWSIIAFGIFAALIQLGIAESLVNTIFIGIVSMLALAGGLAFGLGGRDEASRLLVKLREELTEKRR